MPLSGARGGGPALVVCSHRGPYSYRRIRGRAVGTPGAGGLINAVAPVLEHFGGTWLASALTETDRELVKGIDEGGFRLQFLDLPEKAHQDHYEVVCNQHLWFVFHYLFELPNAPRFERSFQSAWEGYREVNRLYADAVADRREDADVVLIEDFHLLLVGAELRRRSWRTPLVYFHHTPWAEPDYFSLLPDAVAAEILSGVLAHDVAGFHCTRWARAFTACCERLLPGADASEATVRYKGRETQVLVAPAPLDVPRLETRASAPQVRSWRERLQELSGGRKMLLRVDRVELSKNVLRGFLAFEELLSRRPDFAHDLWFLALVYPSRPRVAEYRRYLGACQAAAERINSRFGGALGLFVQDDYHRSLAAMGLYDALLVNPVFDGLNLVAKEGPVLNARDGVLVLSRNAGVFEELGDAALGINPFDVPATAETIERALEMPAADRRSLTAKIRLRASSGTPEGWVRGQFEAAGVRLE